MSWSSTTGPWPRYQNPSAGDFWGICEDRYQVRSTILTSQLPVSRWHERIGDPTLANGILEVHNAQRIEMKGDSMRKIEGSRTPTLSANHSAQSIKLARKIKLM